MLVMAVIIHYSHSSANVLPGKELSFSGVIKDRKERKIDSVFVAYSTEDGFNQQYTHFKVKVNKDGAFNFKLPNLGKLFPMSFSLESNSGKTVFGRLCFAENGDDVRMAISIGNKDTIVFSGNGSAKYNLAEKLNEQYWECFFGIGIKALGLNIIKDSIDLAVKLNSLTELVQFFEARKIELINGNEELSSDAKEILKFHFAQYYDDWAFRVSDVLDKNDNINYRKQIRKYYRSHVKNFCYTPTKIGILSTRYLTMLMHRVKYLLKIDNNKSDLVTFYDTLKNSYKGETRDRILGHFVTGNFTLRGLDTYKTTTLDSLIRDVEKTVEISYIRRAITEKMKVFRGRQVFQSSFTTLTGEIISISSLRGKVVLIDGWFDGCFGCAEFHKSFQSQVYPRFKDNKDFVVLSINADTKKDRWLSGINSKKYTSEEYLNVNAEAGINHPFFKYYGVRGFSWIMLIDSDGKILLDKDRFSSYDDLENKIMEALKEKNSKIIN